DCVREEWLERDWGGGIEKTRLAEVFEPAFRALDAIQECMCAAGPRNCGMFGTRHGEVTLDEDIPFKEGGGRTCSCSGEKANAGVRAGRNANPALRAGNDAETLLT